MTPASNGAAPLDPAAPPVSPAPADDPPFEPPSVDGALDEVLVVFPPVVALPELDTPGPFPPELCALELSAPEVPPDEDLLEVPILPPEEVLVAELIPPTGELVLEPLDPPPSSGAVGSDSQPKRNRAHTMTAERRMLSMRSP